MGSNLKRLRDAKTAVPIKRFWLRDCPGHDFGYQAPRNTADFQPERTTISDTPQPQFACVLKGIKNDPMEI